MSFVKSMSFYRIIFPLFVGIVIGVGMTIGTHYMWTNYTTAIRRLDPDKPNFWLYQLESDSPLDRTSALGVLAKLSETDPRALFGLIQALDDENPEVRDSAVGFLGLKN